MNGYQIAIDLEDRLPEIAREIIEHNTRLPPEMKRSFYENPDGISEHEPRWHQWGIISHTKKFREMYDGQGQAYLAEWGIDKKVKKHLEEKIDGVSKGELIRIAIALHDLGKFNKGRKFKYGAMGNDFDNHEQASEKIIRGQNITDLLHEYGITDMQVDYIASCAGKHFDLGILRKKAKETPLGYTRRYAESSAFQEDLKQVIESANGYKIEIGIMFLSDLLSKTEIYPPSNRSDDELEQSKPQIEKALEQKGLSPLLAEAVSKKHFEISLVKDYLLAATQGV